MTTPTNEQQRINDAQAELNRKRIEQQNKALADQHALAKAIGEKLAGVPMHDTNIGEVALVVLAVLELMEAKHDSGKSHGTAHAK